jgi:hypothetical protein
LRATLFFVRIHSLNDHLPIVTFFTAIAAWWQLAAFTIYNVFEAAILAFVDAGTGRLAAHGAIEFVLFWGFCRTYRLGTIVKRHGHLLKKGRVERDNTLNFNVGMLQPYFKG